MRRLAAVVLAMSAATVATGGCAVGLVVPGPPPATILEVRGGVPGPAFVWVGGYWSWRSRWIWVPGSWMVPPRAHALWAPGRWARCRGGWKWVDAGVLALTIPTHRRRAAGSQARALYSGQGALPGPRHR